MEDQRSLESERDYWLMPDGRVAVTADYGEEGVWKHRIETHSPSRMEVPWHEVA